MAETQGVQHSDNTEGLPVTDHALILPCEFGCEDMEQHPRLGGSSEHFYGVVTGTSIRENKVGQNVWSNLCTLALSIVLLS
jgi:hypothetical protein